MTTGVAQQKVSLKRFSRFAFPIPSAEEQSIIVDRVEQVLSIGSSVEDAVNQVDRGSSNLRQSILSVAFSGELVPQDPGDEPASVLLERIREERAATAQDATRRRPGRRGRAATREEPAMAKTRREIKPTHLQDIIRASNGGMAPEALWRASDLDIDDFYQQLRDEVAAGHLREERRGHTSRIVCR
jgi:type I restriction enzyme S subunit